MFSNAGLQRESFSCPVKAVCSLLYKGLNLMDEEALVTRTPVNLVTMQHMNVAADIVKSQ